MGSGNTVRTVILLTCLTLLFLTAGLVLAGVQGMAAGLFATALFNTALYRYSDRVALWTAKAELVSATDAPELHRTVGELAQRAGVPKPQVYRIDTATPNAFATGRDPKHASIAVTSGLTGMLDSEELAGVLSHELAHIQNRDTLVASVVATVAGAVTFVATVAQWALIFGMGRGEGTEDDTAGIAGLWAGLVMVFFAPVAATLIQLAVSRTREYRADELGADILGDPLALARALERLEQANQARPLNVAVTLGHQFTVQPFRSNGLRGLFSTHPDVAQRVARLRQMAIQPPAHGEADP